MQCAKIAIRTTNQPRRSMIGTMAIRTFLRPTKAAISPIVQVAIRSKRLLEKSKNKCQTVLSTSKKVTVQLVMLSKKSPAFEPSANAGIEPNEACALVEALRQAPLSEHRPFSALNPVRWKDFSGARSEADSAMCFVFAKTFHDDFIAISQEIAFLACWKL